MVLPRITPDAKNPNPSPGIRKVLRLYNASSLSRRLEILRLLDQWHWKRGFPRWYAESEPELYAIYNAMSREERVALSALFARYSCRWR